MEKQSWSRENGPNNFVCSNHFNPSVCHRGFTLIEVIIVIAIIGCISAIALPNYLRYKNNAMIAVAVTDIRMIEKQISLFAFDNDGQLPDILNDLSSIGTINDPWGNPYEYLRIAGGDVKKMGEIRRNMIDVPVNHDYDLYSTGKDGQSQASFKIDVSRDDVVRAYEGSYVGLVSEI
jgi:general secretion pathway protein G